MSEFESKIEAALAGGDQFDRSQAESPRKEIVAMYKKELKTAMIISYAAIAIGVLLETAGFAGLILAYIFDGGTPLMVLCGAIMLSGGQFHLLAKLWYWIMNCRYRIQEDIAKLRLEVAERGD